MADRTSLKALGAAVVLPAMLLPTQACEPPVVPEDWEVLGYSACRDEEHATQEYFDTTIFPLFDAYCVTCHSADVDDRHGAPVSRDYHTLEAASVAPSRTWARLSDFTMPPMGRLPNIEERDLILDWLNCISPPPIEVPAELGDCPDDAAVTSADVQDVLTRECVSCHSVELPEGERAGAPVGVDWDTPADLTAWNDDAYIWSRIQSGEMPIAAPLSAEDAYVFWEWFSCGSP